MLVIIIVLSFKIMQNTLHHFFLLKLSLVIFVQKLYDFKLDYLIRKEMSSLTGLYRNGSQRIKGFSGKKTER